MVEINWTKQAVKDIDNIAEFIAKDSEHYARIQVRRLILSTKSLEWFPKRGKIIPEKQDPLTREIFVGSYRVIYRIVEKTV